MGPELRYRQRRNVSYQLPAQLPLYAALAEKERRLADKPGRLHGLRGERHRLPIGTQNMGQELMRIRQGFSFCPIMHHEKPPAHTFFR